MERIGYQSLVAPYQQHELGNDDNYPPSDHNLMVHVVPEHSKSNSYNVKILTKDSFDGTDRTFNALVF